MKPLVIDRPILEEATRARIDISPFSHSPDKRLTINIHSIDSDHWHKKSQERIEKAWNDMQHIQSTLR